MYLQHNTQFFLTLLRKRYFDNQFEDRAFFLFDLKSTDAQYVKPLEGRRKCDYKNYLGLFRQNKLRLEGVVTHGKEKNYCTINDNTGIKPTGLRPIQVKDKRSLITRRFNFSATFCIQTHQSKGKEHSEYVKL